jgi:hypothetical protein
MPGLRDDQCYQVVKPVTVEPVVAILDRLQFVSINYHLAVPDPNKPPCAIVLENKFPPEIKQLIAELGLGGTTGRAILRRLDAGRGIPAHTDAWMPGESNWRRFQVPLVSHPDIVMRWPDDDVCVHLAPGNLYEVRFDRLHEVVNPTDVARTHLQIDQVDATI